MADHLTVHHPRLKDEDLVYVLQTDWTRLKDQVRRIRDPSFLWGNLAFTVMGFGLSCLASIVIYHATGDEQKLNKTLLGVGYTAGALSLVISALFYTIHKKVLPESTGCRTDIEQTIAVIEAKLIQAETEAPIEGGEPVVQRSRDITLNEMKQVAFRSLSKEK